MALCNDHSGGKPPTHDECDWGAADRRWNAGYFQLLKKVLGLFFDPFTEEPSQLGQLVLRPEGGDPRLKWFNGVEVKTLAHLGEAAGVPSSAVVISLSYPNTELEAAGFTFVKRLTAWVRKMNFGGYPRCGAKGFHSEMFGNEIYICCGTTIFGSHIFKDTWLYKDGIWTNTGQDYPHLMTAGISVSVKDFPYPPMHIGIVRLGYDSVNVRRDLHQFWPHAGWFNWTELPPAAPARMAAIAWVLGRGLFICGGRDTTPTFFSDCWRLDLDTGVWTQMPSMPIPLAAAACFAFDDDSMGIHEAYVVTGATTGYTPTNVCFRFYIEDGEYFWEVAPEFPGCSRFDASGFSYPLERTGYLACGTNTDGLRMDDVWTFDRDTGLWTERWPFAGPGRNAAVGLAAGEGIFIVTGRVLAQPEVIGDCWDLNELFLYQKI
jgi:hypothetical protein